MAKGKLQQEREQKMLKHIVMIKLTEHGNQEIAGKIKAGLETLPAAIPNLNTLEAGINFKDSPKAFDIVLVSEFESEADLAVYAKHPAHIEVASYIKSVAAEVAVVDYKL